MKVVSRNHPLHESEMCEMNSRVWNPDEKRMYYPPGDRESPVIGLDGEVYTTEYNGAMYDLIWSPRSIVLRGLGCNYKDEYHQEIYEGDIIRIECDSMNYLRYGVAVWNDAGFAVKNIISGEMWRVENKCMTHRTPEHTISIPFANTVVLGNKFENYNIIEEVKKSVSSGV